MPTPRYFSPVQGHKVNRFGTSTTTSSNELFGCKAHPETGALTWDEKAVLMISGDEAARFKREYDRLVRDGALVERTEEDRKVYLAQLADENASAKKARDAAAQPAPEAPAPAPTGKAAKVARSPA